MIKRTCSLPFFIIEIHPGAEFGQIFVAQGFAAWLAAGLFLTLGTFLQN
jgi:hypothetical protein